MSFTRKILSIFGISQIIGKDGKIQSAEEFADKFSAEESETIKGIIESEAVKKMIAEDTGLIDTRNSISELQAKVQTQHDNAQSSLAAQNEKLATMEQEIIKANAKIIALEKEFGEKISSLREGVLPKPTSEGVPPVPPALPLAGKATQEELDIIKNRFPGLV